ncbi:MAG TPA: hypothetical protein VIG33_09540 [Pseudobdellovibrionaceae bacterium]|jgi:hypothetical protein
MRDSNLFNKLLLTYLILSAFLMSCTRATKESKSNISFSIPQSVSSKKVGAQAFDTLIHVSINISGSGIQTPIVFNWDSEKKGLAGTTTTAPTSFSFDIPQGPDRLIQVLAVYGDSTSPNSDGGAMQFYYGDVTKTLAAAVEDAPVTVASVGQGTAIISGQIQGRYLTSAGEGPTGQVDIVYIPPGGKTPMVVERSMIMNGWFQFFGLLGAQLGYRLQDGTFLWGGPVDLSEASFPPSGQVMRAALPIHLKTDNYSGTVTTHQEDPSISIYGFFGDSTLVSTKYICKSVSSLTYLLKVGTATALTVTDNNSADPSDLFDTTLSSVNLRGGVALGGASPCDTQENIASNLFGSVLGFKSSMLESGRDNSAGFRLPFQLNYANNSSGSIFSSTVVDADKISISGTLLPGTPSILDNFSVYKAINLGLNFHYHSSFAPCESLTTMGYTLVGDTPVSGGTYTATLPLTSTEASGGAMFVLCPTKAGAPIGPGVWVNASYLRGGGGGGGGGGGVAAKIAFMNLSAITVNQCGHVNLSLLTGADSPTSSANPVTVNLAKTGTGSEFYAENDYNCAGNPITSVVIPANSNWLGVNFKTSATPETDITLTPTDAASALTSVAKTIRARATGSVTEMRFVANSQSANVGTCFPMSVKAVDSNGNLISYNGAVSVTSSGATLYTDSSCSVTSGGTLSFAAGVASFYIKGTTAGWVNLQASATIDTLNFVANYGMAISSAGQPTHLVLGTPSPSYLYINQCMPITVTANDDTNAEAPMPTTQVIKFTASGGGAGNNFYTDANCTNSMVNAETGITSGQTSINIYFKPQNSGSLGLSGFIDNMNYSIGGSQNYTIGSLWMHVISGGFNGSWFDNTCGSLTFELMDNSIAGSGNVIPNLSGSPVPINITTNASTVSGGLYSVAGCTDSVAASKSTAIGSGASTSVIYMNSLLSSGSYVSVTPSYSGSYSPTYQNGNTIASTSFAWCPPVDGGGACASSLALSGPNVAGGVGLFTPGITVGSSMDKTITITNTSSSGVSLGTMTITGGQAAEYTFKGGTYPGTGGTCTGYISPSGTCTVVVTFTPAAINGRYASLNVNYNGTSLPLSLQGTGL